MSVVSKAAAHWSGNLEEGSGTTTLVSSGLGTFDTSWKARSEGSRSTTTPEELLGAAHSACYSMAMSHALGGKGMAAQAIDVTAKVTFVPGEGITHIGLSVSADIPGLDAAEFAELAEEVKGACPVSKALAGTTIELTDVTLA
ncbi:OsmC family peroxiredoxin [Demequina sp. TTPB684]|uniref:OsmC family peroxiredoxin n=1 Tax=unclassified Demequina TaxID=2620311 RepID=UPI001CF273A4|nr:MULTISPECIES: OsmC family peroxiredoxin [unclassified Demequina]MCB2413800.1 OsmC family peroxiredoxin [Demequina sp. TTPB684]UPU89292.1 OsmC family peroxiredoxin [Demequina sp. TMPB413]